jgi:isoleucyl-tRNA synthetase
VIGSRAELEERAVSGLEGLEELRRPWIDDVPVRCEECGEEVRRIEEVGDVWLDAGIVPFSTLGWENAERVPGGFGTGAARGLTTADLPDHAYWEQWFPASWVSEMREQIRLWFYSQLFMSVALVDRAPFREVLGYEKMLDEHGREMHGSWGNLIPAEEAFERMGADVMRWQYCAQPPDRNLLFGYGPAGEIKRKLLRLWNSVSFFVGYASIESFRPRYADLGSVPEGVELEPLDRWLLARVQALVAEATDALEAQLTHRLIEAFERFLDDLSNWYIRRSRARFWGEGGDEAAFRVLWVALVQAVRVVAPVLPFFSEDLWRRLVAEPCGDEAPESVFLAGWPGVVGALEDAGLLAEMAEARRVAELGRRARDLAGVKLRQPLRRLVVDGAPAAAAHAETIRDELRVKELEFGHVDAVELRVKPNLPVLGPRLGPELGAVRSALAAGKFEQLGDGRFRVGAHELGPDEVLVERVGREGFAVAADDGITVSLDTALDDELRLEGRVHDLIHAVNGMRKEAGLELTDRIALTLPAADHEALGAHEDWIARETLAVRVESGDALAIDRA